MVAVKVEDAPVHIGFVPLVCAIAMAGATVEFTVIVITELLAVGVLGQAALLVITHLTVCPLVKPASV